MNLQLLNLRMCSPFGSRQFESPAEHADWGGIGEPSNQLEMRVKKLFLAKTPTGKAKIIDVNGFSVACATAYGKESEADMERLLLCHNALINFSTDDIRQILESGESEFKITDK